eukprot:2099093-Lingulodinium_polyedra.AAC.2
MQRMAAIVALPWTSHGHLAVTRFSSLGAAAEASLKAAFAGRPFVIEDHGQDVAALDKVMGAWISAAVKREAKTANGLVLAELKREHGQAGKSSSNRTRIKHIYEISVTRARVRGGHPRRGGGGAAAGLGGRGRARGGAQRAQPAAALQAARPASPLRLAAALRRPGLAAVRRRGRRPHRLGHGAQGRQARVGDLRAGPQHLGHAERGALGGPPESAPEDGHRGLAVLPLQAAAGPGPGHTTGQRGVHGALERERGRRGHLQVLRSGGADDQESADRAGGPAEVHPCARAPRRALDEP